MSYKKIEIAALYADEIVDLMELKNTINLFDTIEDLAEVIEILDNHPDLPPGLVSSVAKSQRLLIELCRMKTN